VHLVLGPHRFDLRDRTVLIARVRSVADRPAGADALWVDGPVGADVAGAGLPVGAAASGPGDVERLLDLGVALVGVPAGDAEAVRAAAGAGAGVLVARAALPTVAGSVPPEQLLVLSGAPVEGAVACCAPDGDGPGAWGTIARALAAGVRVVRTGDARSARRVATVLDRLRRERPAVAS